MRLLPSRHDATAGLVLGVQSVPDGLATGLLAGLNPSAGLYGYMMGTAGGALFTSSAFMAVQGTGAMAIVIADVPGLSGDDAPRALVTLGLLTGAVMLVAAVVMAVVIVAFGDAVGDIAMPALAGLLILIGIRTVKPAQLATVWHVGIVQRVVLVVTFALTMLIPLQYAVLVGVGLSIVLHVLRQSNQVTIRQQRFGADGHLVEHDPPAELGVSEVVILQPYGSLFFAAAPVFEAMLPEVGADTKGSVVILRLRGRTDLGTTFMDVLHRYATALASADSKLVLASVSDRVLEQLEVARVTDVVHAGDLYLGDERVGATLQRAHDDALSWIESRR